MSRRARLERVLPSRVVDVRRADDLNGCVCFVFTDVGVFGVESASKAPVRVSV
jgi:hypothetical protein